MGARKKKERRREKEARQEAARRMLRESSALPPGTPLKLANGTPASCRKNSGPASWRAPWDGCRRTILGYEFTGSGKNRVFNVLSTPAR